MAQQQPPAAGTIEPVPDRKKDSAGRPPASPAAAFDGQRARGREAPDADLERRRSLRLQLEQSYSVQNGVYADPARPTVPLFVAESRKIVAYDTREPTIRAILDLAQVNRWNAIKATGDKEFQRRVWIEAQARGMEVTLHSKRLLQRAYQPSVDDRRIAAKLMDARGLANRIEPLYERAEAALRHASELASPDIGTRTDAKLRAAGETDEKRQERYRTAIATVDAYLATKGVAANVREAIRNLAHLELVKRDAAGRAVRAMTVDPSAPAHKTPAPQQSREREREQSIPR